MLNIFRLTSDAFETIRLIAVVFAVVLRICLMPVYLQAYLNLAHDRIEEQKKEAGRITNKELQNKITSIFYYLCVVTLQYAAPILMCLFFAIMYKTLGGYSWVWSKAIVDTIVSESQECLADFESDITMTTMMPDIAEDEIVTDASIAQVAQNFQMSMQSLKSVFTQDVYRGLFGFATFWSCFLWFASSSLGFIYQIYFTNKT